MSRPPDRAKRFIQRGDLWPPEIAPETKFGEAKSVFIYAICGA